MTDTLGVHISETHMTAVRFDASSPEAPRVVVLGDSGAATAAVVAQGEGGSVLVGDEAALITEGPRVTNPLQRAATGRIGALAAVFGFVIRRATAVDGRTPERLAVVVDDDWPGAARDRVVQAGVASGMADTIVVPRSAAAAQPTSVTGVAALAAGAARAGSFSSAHFVTREDLGQPITSKTPVVPVVDVPRHEWVSVFEDVPSEDPLSSEDPVPSEDPASSEDPVRTGVDQSSSRPPEFPATRVMGSVGPPAATPRSEPQPRSGLSQAMITLSLVALVGVVGGLLILFTADDSPNIRTVEPSVPEETTPVETNPPTTAVSTTAETSVPPPTSEPETTEAPDVTSSSTTSTSSSTTTTPTTTTTTPVAVGTPGPVTLVETGLQFDTGSVVRFGQPMDTVIDEVRSVLGAPDSATNFRTTDACAEGARSVRWGQLELVFLQDPPVAVPVDPESEPGADGDDGTEFIPASTGTFGQWYASGHTDPTGLVTKDGLGVSATVGFLEATYGASFMVVQPMEDDELGVFSITNPASGGVINGTTSDVIPQGRVLSMWAGDTCTRVFV